MEEEATEAAGKCPVYSSGTQMGDPGLTRAQVNSSMNGNKVCQHILKGNTGNELGKRTADLAKIDVRYAEIVLLQSA
jgi:hypothetical protein